MPLIQPLLEDERTKSFLSLVPRFVEPDVGRSLVGELRESSSSFGESEIIVGDERRRTPRLVAAFSDEPRTYEGMVPSVPWTPRLRAVRDQVRDFVGHDINYGLANWYRDGDDHAGWHSDRMSMHQPDSTVAILSLGASRTFAVRPIDAPDQQEWLSLASGSLLWMYGALHEHYEHAVPKVSALDLPRWSITFRWVRPTVP